MKKLLFGISLILVVSLLTSSCKKTGDTGMNLSFKSKTVALKTLNAVSFDFSEALIGVHEIEIKMESEEFNDSQSSEETEIEYDYDGDYVVDLLTGTSTPDLGFENFVPGNYNKIEAEIHNILDGGTKSISIKGVYTDIEAVEHEFEFSTSDLLEFEIESDAGFYLEEGMVLDLVVKIDLAMLFNGVDFSQAVLNDLNVAIINDTTNSSLADIVKANLAQYSEIEEDFEDDK